MDKLTCLKKDKTQEELKLLEFLENKFSKIDSKTEKLIYGVMKNKHITELNNINFAKENIQNTYIIEKQKLDNLIKIKDNLSSIIKSREQFYINELKKKINPDLLCNICFENRCNIVLNPCGHIFCDNCWIKKEKENICFVCRKDVINSIKIFHN